MTDAPRTAEQLRAEISTLRARLAEYERADAARAAASAARHAEERFTHCIENLLDCFGLFSPVRDPAGRVTDLRIDYMNAAACRNLGLSLDPLLGASVCDLLPAHRTTGLLDRYARVLDTGEPLQLESFHFAPDVPPHDFARDYDIRAFRLDDALAISWRDVSARTHAERARRESETRYRTRFESLPLVAWVNAADGAVRYFNARWMEYTGLPARGDVSRWLDAFGPDDRERIRAVRTDAIARGLPYEAEARLRRHDGAWRWHVCRVTPLRDAPGGPVFGWLGTATDIHDRKLAEQNLRDLADAARVAVAQLQVTIDNVSDCVIVLDPTGHIVRANPAAAALYGFPSVDALFREFGQYVGTFAVSDPDTGRALPVEDWPVPRALRGQFTENRVLALRRTDTGKSWVGNYNVRPVFDAGGAVALVVATVHDLTDQRRVADELRAARAAAESASDAKDQFFATVSHELRSPLTAILGWAQLLRSGAVRPDEVHEALDTIHRNALQESHLVDDLLDVSRIITGKLRVELHPVDLTAVARHAVSVARFNADKKQIRLAADLPPHPLWINGDDRRLDQILANLLNNAIKFTPDRGAVTLSLRPFDGTAQLSVSDTGQGIPPDLLPLLFTRFTQARPGHSGGLGLGLAIARHLAELHAGSLSASSPGPDQGATFTLSLPLRQ